MREKINQTLSVNPRNSIPCALLWPIVLLAIAALLRCAAPLKELPPLPREELTPIMKELHRLAGEYKRALVIEDQSRYAPLAAGLAEQAGKLNVLPVNPEFDGYSKELLRRSQKLAAVRHDAAPDRIDALFGDLMAGCLACHRTFRFGK